MRSRQYVREASSYWRAPVRKDWGTVFEQWMLEAEDLDSILKTDTERFPDWRTQGCFLCQSVKTGQDISGVWH